MLTTQLKDLLRNLRMGQQDPAAAGFLEQLSASDLVADLCRLYTVVFQERRIGRKHEVGLAKFVGVRPMSRTLASGLKSIPVLLNCILVNSYDDSITGVAYQSWIAAIPRTTEGNSMTIVVSRGFKLDKTVDGWISRRLERRHTKLSEDFLMKRGWKFEALAPVWPQR